MTKRKRMSASEILLKKQQEDFLQYFKDNLGVETLEQVVGFEIILQKDLSVVVSDSKDFKGIFFPTFINAGIKVKILGNTRHEGKIILSCRNLDCSVFLQIVNSQLRIDYFETKMSALMSALE